MNFFRRWIKPRADLGTQLTEIRKGLDTTPENVDKSKLVPLFVPASFVAGGNWVGPYELLRASGIALTWSVLLPNQTMRYVDHGVRNHWDAEGIDWKGLALRNLAEHSGEDPSTHALRRANGEVYAVVLMHADGLGPSRLLFRDPFSRLFPNGYRVALPEMSCGFAFSLELDPEETRKIQDLVDNCYTKGTRPLASDIYSPDDLLPK